MAKAKKATKKASKPRKANPKPKAKAKPRKAKPRRNPAAKADPVSFRIAGRQPKPESVRAAAKDVEVILRTYDPVKVSKTRAFYPWLVRRGESLDIGPVLMLHAVCYLAEHGKVSLYTDEDHVPSLAQADRNLLPRMGDTGEPLMWVRIH